MSDVTKLPSADLKPKAPAATALLVTEPEAATALGVSPGTLKAARLHRLESNPLRELPHVRIGRSVRYRKDDIARWIEDHTHHHIR